MSYYDAWDRRLIVPSYHIPAVEEKGPDIDSLSFILFKDTRAQYKEIGLS